MTFKLENLTPIGNNCKAGVVPALWLYWNKATDTVTASGYMDCSTLSLKDQVLVISANGATITNYYVSAVSDGKATLSASS